MDVGDSGWGRGATRWGVSRWGVSRWGASRGSGTGSEKSWETPSVWVGWGDWEGWDGKYRGITPYGIISGIAPFQVSVSEKKKDYF